MVDQFVKRSAMCDLIDLNSPDLKGLRDPMKLASPLIPAPENVESKNSLETEKRENLVGNNPFDKVLNETAEYISKKGDPFEMMLQRAIRFKSKKGADSKEQSPVGGFTDDFTPIRKKRYLKKMNKTLDVLDESLLEDRLNLFGKEKTTTEEAHDGLSKTCICDNNETESITQNYKSVVNLFELSILNQSAMNDSLSDVIPKCKEDDDVFSIFEKQPASLRPLNFQRSLSQGAVESPVKKSCQIIRSQSATSQSDINSIESSSLNRGFIESKQSECSAFSSLSNISSITKWTSASSLSLDPMNHAFLDNSSAKTNQETTNTPENSTEIKAKQYDLSDLAERLQKLKCVMNSTVTSTTDENSTKEDNKQITDDKLIDVDVFVPPQNTSKEYKSSFSNSSTDSASTDSSKVNKAIFTEAKALARTFEELALRSDSGSMDDDLISSNNLWISELVPAFENEPVVDDLIELPVSPEKKINTTTKYDNKTQLSVNNNNNNNNSRDKFLKELEVDAQFTSLVAKQKIINSLLSDLKRLINTENNSEVNKLLCDLETVLNVNCENNTELLRACFNVSNDLQSPQKRLSDSSEKLEKSDEPKSEENSEKALFKENKCDNEKSQVNVTCKLENTSQAVNNDDNSVIGNVSSKNNSEDNLNIINSSEVPKTDIKYVNDKQPDVNLAVELLVNLEKLLTGQVQEATTIELLKNIGKVLDVASNNNNKIENVTKCNEIQNIRRTAPVKHSELNRTPSSVTSSTKSAHRRSFEPKSKPVERKRRSLSAIDSPTNTPSKTQLRKLKETSVTLNSKKRFSSNPGFIDKLANRKIAIPEVARNAKKEEESNVKKVKPVAISDVKNKLKKKSDVINKRGPMKAVHPVDSMQKKLTSLGKQAAPSSQITPPESCKTISGVKIISSTPNSMDSYMSKKAMKSKPVASSTPDREISKASTSVQSTSSDKKRNFSCDISPVTMYENTSNVNDERGKVSPKRLSKLPTPKKCTTPKRQQETNIIPRHYTPSKSIYGSSAKYQYSPRLNRSLPDCQRYSPVSQKKCVEKRSPLKENNGVKVKPYKLISKLKRHNEKENDYL